MCSYSWFFNFYKYTKYWYILKIKDPILLSIRKILPLPFLIPNTHLYMESNRCANCLSFSVTMFPSSCVLNSTVTVLYMLVHFGWWFNAAIWTLALTIHSIASWNVENSKVLWSALFCSVQWFISGWGFIYLLKTTQ